MPEGDSLRRAAERVSALVGERLSVEAPHPRAAALGIAARLDRRRLDGVEAVGKNLLLTFEGGLLLRSHLMMRGRWEVRPAGGPFGPQRAPWLVLRGDTHEAVLWNGSVLELGRGRLARLGPDVMATPLDVAGILRRLRAADRRREVGDALLDQALVAGIGNLWRAEALFLAGVAPGARLCDLADGDLVRIVTLAAESMHTGRTEPFAYGRAGRPCRRCGAPIVARRMGDDARTAYWCPCCQGGGGLR